MADTDLTKEQVMEILNISAWDLRQINRRKLIPRIFHSKRCIRYSLADVIHYRESVKSGGWIVKKEQSH